jgi:hypothetical protein
MSLFPKESIEQLSDSDLFDLLNLVSEELKRRNEILSPSIIDIKQKTPEENVRSVLSALSSFFDNGPDKNG